MLWLHASSGFVQSEEVRRGLHGFGPESSIHILQLALSHMYHYVCQPLELIRLKCIKITWIQINE